MNRFKLATRCDLPLDSSCGRPQLGGPGVVQARACTVGLFDLPFVTKSGRLRTGRAIRFKPVSAGTFIRVSAAAAIG